MEFYDMYVLTGWLLSLMPWSASGRCRAPRRKQRQLWLLIYFMLAHTWVHSVIGIGEWIHMWATGSKLTLLWRTLWLACMQCGSAHRAGATSLQRIERGHPVMELNHIRPNAQTFFAVCSLNVSDQMRFHSSMCWSPVPSGNWLRNVLTTLKAWNRSTTWNHRWSITACSVIDPAS